MKTPDWYREAIAGQGAVLAANADRRSRAVAAVVAAIHAHPEFLEEMVSRDLGKWVRDHESSGDLYQAALFPLIPVRMRTTPRKSVRVAKMTAADLENARAMLMAQTQNAINGADKKRAQFLEFYYQVHPLLKGELTVSAVLGQLATSKAA